MSVYAAARLYGMPRMTLNNHVTGRSHGSYSFKFISRFSLIKKIKFAFNYKVSVRGKSLFLR